MTFSIKDCIHKLPLQLDVAMWLNTDQWDMNASKMAWPSSLFLFLPGWNADTMALTQAAIFGYEEKATYLNGKAAR